MAGAETPPVNRPHRRTIGKRRRKAKLAKLFDRVMSPFLDDQLGRKRRHKLYLGIVVAIALSVSLAVAKLVVLKMLPFDNKSEFQVVVDMPAGTPLENTAAVLREMGAELAKVPEVTDYQAYAGTAAPINFNGLVRQYYLRQSSEMGDLQVNLVDKHHRSDKSRRLRSGCARRWSRSPSATVPR